jgi:4-aminobutyrate aminotransferase-like enzyme
MALAQIGEIRRCRLAERSRRLGEWLRTRLATLRAPGLKLLIRGAGLMVGVEVRRADGSPASDLVLQVVKRMLAEGFILLPEGAHSEVISFTPPLTITQQRLGQTIDVLAEVLREIAQT